MEKVILYTRKSADIEDKQVLFIDAQLIELRKFAAQNNLRIIEKLIEKRTAKMPGRPVFNSLLTRIKNGEATGILAWHPDRLARNSVDGGQIVYLADQGLIKSLRFPTFWFELIRQIYETYPSGHYTLREISLLLKEKGNYSLWKAMLAKQSAMDFIEPFLFWTISL